MATTKPTNQERREQVRRERVERERAQAATATRRRRLVGLGALLGAAALIVGVLIVVSGSGDKGAQPVASSAPVSGARESGEMLAGLPQNGVTLGDPKAPVRVVEFGDLQCPACRQYALNGLPEIVRDYVRPGKASIEFRTLTFIGPDSVRAARVAEAAGRQNKLWNVVELLYFNQGGENSGFATDAFLRRLAGAVPGLDAKRVFAERASADVTGRLKAAQDLADTHSVNSTPTFLVGRGTSLKTVDTAGVPAAIEAALAR